MGGSETGLVGALVGVDKTLNEAIVGSMGGEIRLGAEWLLEALALVQGFVQVPLEPFL